MSSPSNQAEINQEDSATGDVSEANKQLIPKGQGDIDAYASTFTPGSRFYLAFTSLLILSLMATLDATSISVAIRTITTVLHGTAVEGFWSGTSFLLTSTVSQPIFGSFSDIFGRKPMILIALVFFCVGVILAAVARSMTVLLIGRSIQGIGGGGVIVLIEILVTDLVPLRFRGNYFGSIASMWAVGSILGPVVGGAFSREASWRWIFWINLPFLCLGGPLVLVFLKLDFKVTTLARQLRRVDWMGMVLFTGSITGLLIPLTSGGVMHAWLSWETLLPLLVCIVGLVAFVIWEERCASDPLIRTSVLKNRTAAVSYFGDFTQGLLLWCSLYYMPLYYQAVKSRSPVMSGVDLFPASFTVAPTAVVVGATISKVGSYRWAVWAGWTLATLGFGIQCLLDVYTSTVAWVFITLVTGIGTGMLFPSLTFAIQAATPNRDQAYAVSLFTFLRAAGQTTGVAVGGTIFQNRLRSEILSRPLVAGHAEHWSADATVLVEIINAMPQSMAKDDIVQCYANSLKTVWAVMCVFSGVALVASLGTQHFSLDRALETDHGFKYNEKAGVEGGDHSREIFQLGEQRTASASTMLCRDMMV